MPDQPNHRLPEEFGGNEWLVDELYEQYLKDKNSVDKKWWSIFDSFKAEDAKSSTPAIQPPATVLLPRANSVPTRPPASCPL